MTVAFQAPTALLKPLLSQRARECGGGWGAADLFGRSMIQRSSFELAKIGTVACSIDVVHCLEPECGVVGSLRAYRPLAQVLGVWVGEV